MIILTALIIIALGLFYIRKRREDKFFEYCEKVKAQSEKSGMEVHNKSRQRQEDIVRFCEYAEAIVKHDAKTIMESDTKTRNAIKEFPSILEDVTDEQIERYSERYYNYKKKSERLFGMPPFLNPREFTVQMLNPALCASFDCILVEGGKSTYMIYDWETAKYRENAKEKLEQEFKEKYY